MALSDAIGSGPDFTGDSVLDRVSRSILPDLPENVSADAVLNRLNRKLTLAKPAETDEEKKPELANSGKKTGKPDFSSEGTPVGDLPDLSSYGTPADAVPLPQPRPAGAPQPSIGVTGNLAAAGKGLGAGAAESTGGILQGLGTAGAAAQSVPGVQAAAGTNDLSNQFGDTLGADALAKQQAFEGRVATEAKNPETNALVKAGKAVKSLAPDMTDAEKESIGGRIGHMAGAIAPYAAATLVDPAVGIAAGFTGMAADAYGNVYRDAKAKGADDETARGAATKSALVAGVLGSLPLGAGKYAQSLIGKVATSSAAFATAGEAQEAILQQIAKDYDPKAGYTFDQKRLIAELILGAGMGGLHHATDRKPENVTTSPDDVIGQPGPQARAPSEGLPPPQPDFTDVGGGQSGPSAGAGSWQRQQPPGGGAGPKPGPDAGAQPGAAGPQPGPDTGGPGAAEQPRGQQAPPPGAEQPEAEPARGAKGADYTMDPKTRSKMEDVLRRFDPKADWKGMSDADLFNTVQEHLRDTSSTGYSAKPETNEEKAAREQTAADRAERETLKKAGWVDAQIDIMTPEQRKKYAQPKAQGAEPTPETPVSKKEGEASISPEAENMAAGTREAPIRPATAADVVKAQAAEPTPAQAAADNYKQAHVELPHLGLSGKNGITIETGVGGTRKSKETGPDGKPTWETTMQHGAYGKIRGTKGMDGDHLDIFVGPHPQSPHVFVLDQLHPDGSPDEHKVLAGYRTPIDALHGYANSYDDLAKGRIGGLTAFTPDQFKDWLRNGDHTKPVMTGQKLEVGTAVASPAAPKESPAATGAEAARSTPKTSTPAKGSSEPLSLLQFVASKGGIKPHPELAALDLNGKHRVQLPGQKGFFGVVRPGGEDLDRMREAAEEAGYLRGEHNKTSTVRDFLDALDEELRGQRKAAEGEELAKSKRDEQLAAERERHDQERDEADYGEARRTIADAGYTDLPSDLYNAAAKLVADEGLDPDSAVERAAERLVAEDSIYPVTADEFDTTYGQGAYDAAQTRPASENGEPASRPRAERARPGEGEEDRPNGAGVSHPGAPGGQDQEVIAAHRDAIEQALGTDADRVSQVDIASAAELMADHPDMDVAAAFGRAVVENAVRQKFLTELEALKAYGKEVEGILGTGREGASGGGAYPEPGGAEPRQERAGGASQTSLVPSGGKTSSAENPAAAKVQDQPVDDTRREDADTERNASGETAAAEAGREAAEGRAAKPEEPKPTVEKGADGKDQTVLPGAEKARDADMAQRAANAPLKPKVAQKSADIGLFSDEKDQMDMLAEPRDLFGRGAEGQRYTLEQGRKTGNEHLVAYDASGLELGRRIGVAREVGVSPEIEKAMLDPHGDIVVHHNHPSGATLSAQDIAMLGFPGLRAVWAHGHSGNVFRAELTSEAKAALQGDPTTRARKLQAVQRAINNEIYSTIQSAVDWHGVTVEEAHYGLHKLRNEILRDAGIIDYRTNDPTAEGFISRIPGLHMDVKSAIRLAQKQVFNEQRSVANRPDDRRSEPLRHAGDLGATFDRGELAAPVDSARRSGPPDKAVHRPEKTAPVEDKGVGGAQPRLLEDEAGFAQPDNTFKKERSFDTSIGDILHKRLLGRLSDLNLTEARVQLQDKFLRVRKAEEAKANTNSDLSAYQAESLYYGRTGHRLEQLREHHIDPIIRDMKGRDIDLEQMDKFLYARHAPERNNAVGKMYAPNEDFHKAMNDPSIVGGSGMSTNDALKIIRDIKAAGKLPDYLAVAKMIDAINYKTRRTLFDSGLIDRATFDSMNNSYKYYVPLRGWAEGSEDEASLGSQGSGNDIRGDETKRAFGRKSEAASPVAYSLMQAELAIVRAEKNKVGNTFLRFVRSNPDPKLWAIDRPDQRKNVSKVTGLVTSIDNGLSYQADNVFATKVDGKTVHITLKGPDGLNVARALKNMGTAQVHAAIRMIATVTHAMAKLATSWNPNFMIPNLARDLGEAFINLQAQEQKTFIRSFAGHIIPAIRGSMMAIAGKTPDPANKMAKYVEAFHRYDKEGGRIHFFGIDDPDKIEGNVNAKLKRLDGGLINGVKDLGEKAGKAFEILGGGIENATRLASFMAAEDAGLSTPDAAMLARNLTVDFNKKGELGSAISSLYMFSNAGAQGIARGLRALGHKRVWAAVGTLAAVSAMATLYDIGAGGEDEAGTPTYMKIPPWERDKNLILMLRNGSYAKLPLPYGFAPFAVAGAQAAATLMGKQKPGAAAMAIVNSITSAFNPLGEEDSWAMSLVPSFARPIFHIAFNKDWTGKPLYPDADKAKGMPVSGQSFRTNSDFSKAAAKDINKATGGNDYAPGLIDVHPGAIDHLMSAVTGGIGKFVKDIADTIMTGATDHEWAPEKTPILRRFVGKVGADADRFAYYEARDAEKQKEGPVTQAKKDRKAGINEDEAQKVIDSADTPQARIFKNADKQMSRLRKDEAAATNEAIPYDEKKTKLDAIRQEMRDVQNHARAESAKLKELVH